MSSLNESLCTLSKLNLWKMSPLGVCWLRNGNIWFINGKTIKHASPTMANFVKHIFFHECIGIGLLTALSFCFYLKTAVYYNWLFVLAFSFILVVVSVMRVYQICLQYTITITQLLTTHTSFSNKRSCCLACTASNKVNIKYMVVNGEDWM